MTRTLRTGANLAPSSAPFKTRHPSPNLHSLLCGHPVFNLTDIYFTPSFPVMLCTKIETRFACSFHVLLAPPRFLYNSTILNGRFSWSTTRLASIRAPGENCITFRAKSHFVYVDAVFLYVLVINNVINLHFSIHTSSAPGNVQAIHIFILTKL